MFEIKGLSSERKLTNLQRTLPTSPPSHLGEPTTTTAKIGGIAKIGIKRSDMAMLRIKQFIDFRRCLFLTMTATTKALHTNPLAIRIDNKTTLKMKYFPGGCARWKTG